MQSFIYSLSCLYHTILMSSVTVKSHNMKAALLLITAWGRTTYKSGISVLESMCARINPAVLRYQISSFSFTRVHLSCLTNQKCWIIILLVTLSTGDKLDILLILIGQGLTSVHQIWVLCILECHGLKTK